MMMASSSESMKKWKYDVFLNFRGEDTRMKFTSHLYEALCQKGIYTFIDNEELKRGEKIPPSLFKAIEDSRISLVILSKSYASSTSCLDELLKILEVKDSKRQVVLPVFYDVNPSEVRDKKGGCFEEDLAKHEDKFKVKRWKDALCDVASLSGWHLKDGHESTFIQRIVEEIQSKLNRTPLNVAKHPVGLDSPMKDIKSLLESESQEGVRFIGIYGIGGIGKTTLAKAIYNHVYNQFEASTFIANVREISNQRFGLLKLQETLLSETLNYRDIRVGNVDRGINLIKRRLCNKRVLVVLDDVDSSDQLDSLAGETDWFGSGSRIIITTRDKHLLIGHNVEMAYKVKELSHHHALELFSWYAFKKPFPPKTYEKFSSHILNYAKGLPLALSVLGSNLCGRSMVEWRSALEKLKNTPSKHICEVLKISFDGLEENEKAIFLDIACFFKGEDKGYVKKILEGCDMHPDNGIGVLVEKSLITIELNKLWMHDLVQEMGKEIIRSESQKEPEKRSRLWFHRDILQVLTENTGTNNIEGLMLDMPEPEEKVHISGKAFANMKKLRLLRVHNANISDDIQYLSDELRLIDWPRYPSSTLPPNFHPKRLVSLNLSHGRIKHLWKGAKILRDLKLVSFNCCEYLTEIPDFSMIPNLESLNLEHCKTLVKIHESIGSLSKLVTLNLVFCSNLKSLPSYFKLKYLHTLLLTGCSNLRKFPEISDKMEFVEEILLEGTSIKELPQSIENLIALKCLVLDFCQKLENLPSSIQNLQYLTTLSLTNCSKLKEIPKLPLKTSYIDTNNCTSLENFPDLSTTSSFSSSQEFPRFSHMSFINCHRLIHKKIQDHIANYLFYEESISEEVIFPGSKIPDWFDYHSTNNSPMISLDVASRLYGKPVELYFGAVFELNDKARRRGSGSGIFLCVYEIVINHKKTLIIDTSFDSLETSHVWLSKIKFGRLMWPYINHSKSSSMRYWNHVEVSFRISPVEVSSSKDDDVKVNAVLKCCGFHISCKQEGYVIDETVVRKHV